MDNTTQTHPITPLNWGWIGTGKPVDGDDWPEPGRAHELTTIEEFWMLMNALMEIKVNGDVTDVRLKVAARDTNCEKRTRLSTPALWLAEPSTDGPTYSKGTLAKKCGYFLTIVPVKGKGREFSQALGTYIVKLAMQYVGRQSEQETNIFGMEFETGSRAPFEYEPKSPPTNDGKRQTYPRRIRIWVADGTDLTAMESEINKVLDGGCSDDPADLPYQIKIDDWTGNNVEKST